MATTPRPYLWQFNVLRASSVENTGAAVHYFSEDAQTLYLKNGIAGRQLFVDDGHWEEAEAEEEVNITSDEYSDLSFTHPANGNLYGVAILPGDESTLYLLRYGYMKDISKFISQADYMLQADNPITQMTANMKNYSEPVFTKQTTLFEPGAKVTMGLMMGDSPLYEIGQAYLDEINFGYNRSNLSISGRNSIGHLLNDQTFDAVITYNDEATEVVKSILEHFGITKFFVEENSTTIKLKCAANDSGLKALQTLSDIMSDPLEDDKNWDIEETPDGTLIIGYDEFRSYYMPKSRFEFNGRSDIFKRSSSKMVDGAYTRVYCTGKTTGGSDLQPVSVPVNTFPYWSLGAHKTYFAPTLEEVTQSQLQTYAEQLAKQLKYTGITESYEMPIRPQLLVGDVVDITIDNTIQSIGTITEVQHILGERGYKTSFTVSSGGDATNVGTKVYTNARRNKGNNRKKRITDFIK